MAPADTDRRPLEYRFDRASFGFFNHWYGRGTLSQERAAELAGLTRRDFIRALVREGLDVFVLDDDSLTRELSQSDGGATDRS